MSQSKFRLPIPFWLFLFLIVLGIHLIVLPKYGFTWDFHHHFFAGAKFFGFSWNDIEPRPLPYTSPDPRGTYRLPYGPFVSIIPFGSYYLFHVLLTWLPDDVAYHLPITVIGGMGPVLLYLFLREATKKNTIALLGAVFLFLTPRYFGDLHNNMKDVPIAVVFCLNVWLLWRLVTYRRMRDCVASSIGFAVAFSTKVNSLFIPILLGAFLTFVFLRVGLMRIMADRRHLAGYLKKHLPILLYFLLAPVFAFLLWWAFWGDAIGQLKLMFTETFLVGTNNIEVLFDGNWYCSGRNVPWYYPYGYLAITTPLPVLGFSIIGAVIALAHFFRKKQTAPLLLVLWFFVPLTRYLAPGIGVIDGIRHFQEVVFPIAALAAYGAYYVAQWFSAVTHMPQRAKRFLGTLGITGIAGYLALTVISFHPYQITYFNELVGGIRGALGKYDLDYWGTSQKQAIEWVNANAPQNSSVDIVMAADVASRYLRPDLLSRVNQVGFDDADYVVLLNRQSFFYRFYYIVEYMLRRKAAYTVELQGVPLTWVFQNSLGKFERTKEWWHGDSPCLTRYWNTPPP